MDKNAVEWKPEPQEETTVYGKRTSEALVDVVRDAIDAQRKQLETAIIIKQFLEQKQKQKKKIWKIKTYI